MPRVPKQKMKFAVIIRLDKEEMDALVDWANKENKSWSSSAKVLVLQGLQGEINGTQTPQSENPAKRE